MDPTIKRVVQTMYWLRIWRKEGSSISNYHKFYQICVFGLFYVLYGITLALGALICDNVTDTVYLCVTFLSVILLSVIVLTFSWNQNEVESILNELAIDRNSASKDVCDKISSFTKFSNSFKVLALIGSIVGMLLPLSLGSIPFKIWFPLDWKNNIISYWIAVIYCLTSYTFSIITAVYLRLFLWFLMLNASLQYELLAKRLKSLGLYVNDDCINLHELKECFRLHGQLKEAIYQFRNCFAHVFLFQIMIGALCICCPILLLAIGNTSVVSCIFYACLIIYMVLDTLTITYFGNEIFSKSNDLSWCLYESDWINKTRIYRRYIKICMGFFAQPQKMIVGIVFSLNLKTFTSILNSAYTMFNILRNL